MRLPVKLNKEQLDNLGVDYKTVSIKELDSNLRNSDISQEEFDNKNKNVSVIIVRDNDDIYTISHVKLYNILGLHKDKVLRCKFDEDLVIYFKDLSNSIEALNNLVRLEFIDERYRDYKESDVFKL